MSFHLVLFLSIFPLLHPTISSDFLSPLLSPFLDDICKDAVCGKGTCKASINHTFSFYCECKPGWKQSLLSNNTHMFLPCVIPDCTLDYSCTKAPSPSSQVNEPQQNTSFFDPCNWAYCGEGSCVKKSTFKHECQCKEGYANLLNITTFPCFNECSLGMDCESLGLTVSNKSPTGTPTVANNSGNHGNLTDNSENHACSILQSNYMSIIMLVLSLAMVTWK